MRRTIYTRETAKHSDRSSIRFDNNKENIVFNSISLFHYFISFNIIPSRN
jgi:hypothetical protein